MKTRNTIIWLLIFICLGGFVYYHEILGGKKRQQAKEAAQKIFNISPESISELRLSQQTSTIHCVKNNDGHWQLLAPIQAIADDSAVLDFIQAVLNGKIERVIEETAKDLTPYGLNSPTLTTTLLTGNTTKTLLIGKDTPTHEFLYAKRNNDEKIFLLPADMRQKLTKDLYALRNKQIIKAQARKVSKLVLKYPGAVIVLFQDPAKGWQMLEPVKTRADNKTVHDLIYIMDGVHAQKFVEEKTNDLAQYGLDKPQAIIDLTMDDGTQQILLLGKNNVDQSAVYAKQQDKDPIFTLPKQTGDFLIKDVFSMRDKTLLFFLPQELKSLELADTNQTILLKQNDDGTWVVLKPETGVAVADFMKVVLKSIARLQAKDFIDQPKVKIDYGFEKPTLKATLTLKNGSAQTLSVGKKKPGSNLAYAKMTDQITLVDAKEAEQIALMIAALTGKK